MLQSCDDGMFQMFLLGFGMEKSLPIAYLLQVFREFNKNILLGDVKNGFLGYLFCLLLCWCSFSLPVISSIGKFIH